MAKLCTENLTAKSQTSNKNSRSSWVSLISGFEQPGPAGEPLLGLAESIYQIIEQLPKEDGCQSRQELFHGVVLHGQIGSDR